VSLSFGIKLPGVVPTYAPSLREVPDLVVELERLGYDDVMDGEHILFAPRMAHPGGSGNFEHGRDRQHSDRFDSMLMFSAIAARTSRIKLFSGIILGAAHTFAVLARQAATLDALSQGRFVLGVGAGWFEGEFAAMGIPPAERAPRLEETIRACQELWSPGLSSYSGKWISFEDMISEPAPWTEGGVPVWWGGDATKRPTARRVVTLSQGWLSREAAGYDEIAASIDNLRVTCEEFGRDPATIGARASLTATGDWKPEQSFDELVEAAVHRATLLAGAGVTHFNVPLSYYGISLEQAGELLTALRGVTA
jgi:probable F420-dependent oxidoreductase